MPNVAIMKDMGASDGLIEYIRHTTWNTNLGMLAAYGCEPEGDDEGEVWAESEVNEEGYTQIELELTPSETSGVGKTTKSFNEWKDLLVNPQSYIVSASFKKGTETVVESLLLNERVEPPQWDGMWDFGNASVSGGYLDDQENGWISIAGGVDEDATDVQIIVTKK